MNVPVPPEGDLAAQGDAAAGSADAKGKQSKVKGVRVRARATIRYIPH